LQNIEEKVFEVLMMDKNNERRKEQRLHYHWPVWFAEDFNDNKTLLQGQMVDVCSAGAAFTCHADESCLHPGQHITARFSVPCFGPDESFDMANFTRSGRICRVDNVNSFLHRVAIQFVEPLPFKPGEQASSKFDTQQRLKTATI
jgi:hypothetical protein